MGGEKRCGKRMGTRLKKRSCAKLYNQAERVMNQNSLTTQTTALDKRMLYSHILHHPAKKWSRRNSYNLAVFIAPQQYKVVMVGLSVHLQCIVSDEP